ncbi:CHAP domain-containing protein [Aeromicrobium sp. HA]|uniref:CHAP domain-containing protein n=1 Tax=Aeromicrobium sp. HA TaxID=3009077 RepID=UPI0022AF5CFE|nr:CHAP domain-containing protein [Aeromicrobium sp. HA]
MALALVLSLIALPSHAESVEPEPEVAPSAEVTSEPAEPEDVAEPETGSPEASEPAAEPAAAASAAPARRVTASRAPAATAASAPSVNAPAKSGRWVSIRINSGADTRVLTRENFWLRGRVLTTSGKPHARTKVRIYRDTKNGRVKVATVRTSAKGWYSWMPKVPKSGTYRAIVSRHRYSPKITVKRTYGKRSLASREKAMSFLLGSPKGGVKRARNYVYREYTKATLVQYGGRTSVVRTHALKQMRARGGAGGSLGAPTGDLRCGLPEGACLQQFRTGAVYVNKKAKKTVTSAVSPKLGAADLVAVARSQVGYREPKPRKSKYNRWIKRTGAYDPWCGFFVSWLAYAADKPGSVIKAKSFGSLLKAERKRGRTSQTPRVGRLAYIGYFSKGTASHVGIVAKHQGDYVWTVEGNVSSGGGMAHPRGVHIVKRHRSNVVFYADPKY